jgi:hypothetical protein
MATYVRLANGEGPEITLPEWHERTPTPDEWIDWFGQQSREAQRHIVAYNLAAEQYASEHGWPLDWSS